MARVAIKTIFLLFLFFSGHTPGRSQSFLLFEDSARNLTPKTALQFLKDGRFSPQAAKELNIGFTRSVFWLALQLPEGGGDSVLLEIGDQHINRIHFYKVSETALQPLYLTGDYYPYKQRPLPTTGFYFPLPQKGTYLARIDKSNESLQLSFGLVKSTEALRSEAYSTSVMAGLSGMILLLLIFGIYLLLISRDLVYLLYVLYLAAGWGWVLANSGHGFQYLWPGHEWFASKARPVFAMVTAALSVQFLVHYIDAARQSFVRRIVRGITVFLSAAVIAIFLFNEQGYQSPAWMYLQFGIPVVVLCYIIFAISLLVIGVIRGNKLAVFYLVAIGTLLVLTIIQLAFYTGAIDGHEHFIARFGMALGYVVESIILTAGLAYRFNQYKKEREHLLLEMNRRQLENTRILMEVQESERSQIADQLHDVAGSLLSAARLNLSSLRDHMEQAGSEIDPRFHHTEEAIAEVGNTVRNLSHALSPVMLTRVGFRKALEKMAALFNAPGRIQLDLIVSGFEEYKEELAPYYNGLYGVLYELLNNIVKHSAATEALVQVSELDDCFTLIVEDNGIGFSLEAAAAGQTLGLAGVSSKISYFKGHLAIEPNSPKGTLITIEIPRV